MAAPHEELRRNHVKALESISQLTKENVRALQRVEALTKENEALKAQGALADGRLVPAGLQSLLELKDAAEAGELATLRRGHRRLILERLHSCESRSRVSEGFRL